jgi:phosphoribosylaminoimidazole-succinocarboxamide synthase
MEKKAQLYEGKAKKVFETSDPNLVIQYFKDDATAFNAQKKGTIKDKGIVNNNMSVRLFRLLEENSIPTHFVKQLSDREMLVKKLKILPVEVVVRNIIAGSLAKRLGIEEGISAPFPIVEFYYKKDALGDPLVIEDHIKFLGLATAEQIRDIKNYSLRINDVLSRFFDERDILLVDFKLEFGMHNNDLLLGDEIAPDTCRLWDKKSMEKLDKDRFRRDLGNVEEAYQEVLKRVLK